MNIVLLVLTICLSAFGAQVTTSGIANNAVTDTKIRLTNNSYLRGRNNANSADVNIIRVTTSDGLELFSLPTFSGSPLVTQSSGSGIYVLKSDYPAKGQILVGTGSGTYDAHAACSNGQVLSWDSTQTDGVICSTGGSGDIKSDGSVAFAANESMGGNKITNLGTPTVNTDAATKQYVDTAVGGSGITGSGTTNSLPKFTASTAVGNSQIYDNGTNIGVGTTSPVSPLTLDIRGDSVLYASNPHHAFMEGFNIANDATTSSFGLCIHDTSAGTSLSSSTLIGKFGAKGQGAVGVDNLVIDNFYSGADHFSFEAAKTSGDVFLVQDSGNLGVANRNPGALVDIGNTDTSKTGIIRMRGATSGYTEIATSDTGGNIRFTLPTSVSNGFILQTDSSGNLSAVRANKLTVSAITADPTPASTDIAKVYNADSSGAAFNISLPNPSTVGSGWYFYVMDTTGSFGANNVTLVRFASEKIQNVAASFALNSNFGWYRIYTNGTDWWVGK